jgi:DNA-binding CsgD family transcriptional regulator
MNNEVDTRIARLEGRLESVEKQLNAFLGKQIFSPSIDGESRNAILPRLTPKQHVSMQMLMKGYSNAEIAKRLGVTENTAKVHVRAIAKKYGVQSRSQIVMQAFPEYEAIPASTYEVMTGGIPKDWAEQWLSKAVKHDPYRSKYQD